MLILKLFVGLDSPQSQLSLGSCPKKKEGKQEQDRENDSLLYATAWKVGRHDLPDHVFQAE